LSPPPSNLPQELPMPLLFPLSEAR